MNMVDIIIKKRNGNALTKEEIEWFVQAYTNGEVPDYQASALLMAIYYQHMNEEETNVLTKAMQDSGVTMDLSGIPGIKVDKHSTGGIGDKTTMIVAPLAAACGVPIAKMSGRGLGMTGGTIDKLCAIPGFEVAVKPEDFIENVREKGIAVVGQSADLAKADKLLYALRDVTGTVDEPSLIASSIMSKKLASGADAILLDVKCGSGAFMQTEEAARDLAERMVRIGNAAGKRTIAVITGMEQPLGQAAGNSCEVVEAIETLKGRGPEDITALSLHLASLMVLLGGKADDFDSARVMAEEALLSGRGLDKFREMIAAQNGNEMVIDDIKLLPRPAHAVDILAQESGYVTALDASLVGAAVQKSGAGRARKEDEIDESAGAYLYIKTGGKVNKGDRLARLFGADAEKIREAAGDLRAAYQIGEEAPAAGRLIIDTIGV
ncbi:MAG: thymidine phosphorylase [Clostridiales bacterium]|nr:thymidine phosphorylase [Clostridiales bacterium]